MHAETVSRLLDLNRLFYQQFGHAFAATRQRLQPGVTGLVDRLPLEGGWLDLGCGSGELARELKRRGFIGSYVGLDFSKELIEEAGQENSKTRAGPHPLVPSSRNGEGEVDRPRFDFLFSDLSSPAWSSPFPSASFDTILAFASLHHLPGLELRRRVLLQARRLLAPGGRFIHSEWQFQHSPRLWGRVQPWERIGLSAAEVDENDYLLDWRYALADQAEAVGLRYVHLFSLVELDQLALGCGFEISETFASDGQGGRLGLYQVWRAI